MGAYSPAPVVTPEMHDRIMQEVIIPTVEGMKADGYPYTGFLYAGIMIAPDGTPGVLEYNCRFGDPEAQPVLARLQSDLASHCLAAVEGHLDQEQASWDDRSCLGVVIASAGYPGAYVTGHKISGLSEDMVDTQVFHAGTALAGSNVVTSGGRVLCVTAFGNSVAEAQRLGYQRGGKISWQGSWYRQDIGHRAIARENTAD